MPLTRRTLLRGAFASAALGLPVARALTTPAWGAPAAEAEFRSADWTLATPADWADGTIGGLARLPAGGIALVEGSSGTYRSNPHQLPFRADAAGLTWALDGPIESAALRVRAGDDGRTWSEWQAARPLAHGPREEAAASEPVGLAGRYWQVEVELRAAPGRRPALRRLTLRAVGSSGPDLGQAVRAAAPIGSMGGGDSGPPAPKIIARRDWGCPEPSSSPSWSPQYQSAVKVFVHHTVTANADPNPPATVRAIWQYHARTLDWGDIGYNYLVDRWGNLYEGRYGGDNAIAGHALCYNPGSVGIALLGDFTTTNPPQAAIDALTGLIAWIVYRKRIHPLKSAYFINRVLSNICGHRDGNNGCGFFTECPGDRLFARLEEVRNGVWDRFPEYADEWGSIASPARLAAGEAVAVRADVTNLGRRFWSNADPNPIRLGYHWYRSDGSQVVQPTDEDRRTKLPQGLDFGGRVQFDGWVQAPRQPGRYTLKWDLVHEGYLWLADRGNPTVDVSVEVYDLRLPYRVKWGSHTTPTKLAPGETANVRLDLQNLGGITWIQTPPNSIRLGYHWYRPDGTQVVQPPADDRRTHFPRAIGPDESVTVDALLTASSTPGRYTLKWDIVHEGITWFADQGSPTLDVPVEVVGDVRKVYLPVVRREGTH